MPCHALIEAIYMPCHALIEAIYMLCLALIEAISYFHTRAYSTMLLISYFHTRAYSTMLLGQLALLPRACASAACMLYQQYYACPAPNSKYSTLVAIIQELDRFVSQIDLGAIRTGT